MGCVLSDLLDNFLKHYHVLLLDKFHLASIEGKSYLHEVGAGSGEQ